jgi:hypothetical protein
MSLAKSYPEKNFSSGSMLGAILKAKVIKETLVSLFTMTIPKKFWRDLRSQRGQEGAPRDLLRLRMNQYFQMQLPLKVLQLSLMNAIMLEMTEN